MPAAASRGIASSIAARSSVWPRASSPTHPIVHRRMTAVAPEVTLRFPNMYALSLDPATLVPIVILGLGAALAVLLKRDRAAAWLVAGAVGFAAFMFQAMIQQGYDTWRFDGLNWEAAGLVERALQASDALVVLLVPALVAGGVALRHGRSFVADRRLVGVLIASLTPLASGEIPCASGPSWVWQRVLLWLAVGILAVGVRARVTAAPVCWLAALLSVERFFLHVDTVVHPHCFNGGVRADPEILSQGFTLVYLSQQGEIAALGLAWLAGTAACWERRVETMAAVAMLAAMLLFCHPVWIYHVATM